ncbi:hypothetical protein [Mucilaginibacter ginkgonis]|uniref:Uncharacterized protein n=1 Tax=Mucilaginibacter ginkgonis TaxID=2682091 RepID=A0A6I4HZ99_9SPHI|nr:hypothetical protein [Mucilaginibacter ginkgonis]QQL49423.1 hypothetical protein GO620_014800 [Mucilaginibacter ginkgonis]
MKILLSPQLLRFLLNYGFRFCLSKTSKYSKKSSKITILLKPVFTRPDIHNLPDGYDTYFNIVVEPAQMAYGIDGTTVLVKLDGETFLAYVKSILIPIPGKKLSHE